MSRQPTYAIRHNGETTWMSGADGVARWLCNTYGLNIQDNIVRLTELVERNPKLRSEELGLMILLMSKPLAELHTMVVEGPNGLEPRPYTVNMTAHGRLEPELRPGEQAFHTVDGKCVVIQTGSGR